jgi:hypothetical protein
VEESVEAGWLLRPHSPDQRSRDRPRLVEALAIEPRLLDTPARDLFFVGTISKPDLLAVDADGAAGRPLG